MKIVTLTINPALDKSTHVEKFEPEHKLRCAAPIFEPGGGGINVTRAIRNLGGDSLAYYLSGGATGQVLQQLLDDEGITHMPIPSVKWTRENFSVTETSTDKQYRFGMPGSVIPEYEWQYSLIKLEKTLPKPEYIVASGSLPRGVPNDFYARVATIAKKIGAKLILDTSGEALMQAAGIGVYLLKPNLNELAMLAGKTDIQDGEIEQFGKQLLANGMCEVLVVSMGGEGAMLITKDQVEHIPAPKVKTRSTVGAGDSMVAGLVYKLSLGWSLSDSVKYGVAAGAAAVMSPGSELCRRDEVEELYKWIKAQNLVVTNA
ncbi:1-phosphofructokinase family hexose kinase [Adhaeribacter pallidiroseus]|uniref:1-phosphofructokinase n=1 Tax=Adhaeribacter pallidiroseus TaxID=2072847 RepID=A0A369QN75_9BACT|nr:1-phosphofructokinase family hexose kinase [Adhaeribacter pallidiroseus]RDC63658.1 1-phosphofructokinase [Adhaeribacter pallidiroseus]